MLLKVSYQMFAYFPTTNASALAGETQTPEIIFLLILITSDSHIVDAVHAHNFWTLSQTFYSMKIREL